MVKLQMDIPEDIAKLLAIDKIKLEKNTKKDVVVDILRQHYKDKLEE